MKRHFEHARDALPRPVPADCCSTRTASRREADASAGTFRADDRLVKTLLLAALVPQAQPLRNLDVAKLTALNHGSIVVADPGGEKQRSSCRSCARGRSQVGALKVGDDPQNPTRRDPAHRRRRRLDHRARRRTSTTPASGGA